MSFPKTYRANGKLLLTGEYVVLHGATAIALPLNVGQRITIFTGNSAESLNWQAFYGDNRWFSCELNPAGFSVIKATDQEKAETLSRIFQTIKKLNPDFQPLAGTRVETTLEFNPEWGLGSSSTLVSLLAQWSGVDPFRLNELVFQGSGFDIACAAADGPVFYTRNRPAIPVKLEYPFADRLFLVYSGQKKGTARAVRSFLNEKPVPGSLVEEMTALSGEIALCRDQEEFNRLLNFHEKIIGKLIGQVPVRNEFFPDFDGAVKSLGAWGGDFLLASTYKRTSEEVKNYFENKGLATLFKWNDLILKRR